MRTSHRKSRVDLSTAFLPGFEPDAIVEPQMITVGDFTPIALASARVAQEMVAPAIIDTQCIQPDTVEAIEFAEASWDIEEVQEVKAIKPWPRFSSSAGVPPEGELARLTRNIELLKLARLIQSEGRNPTEVESEHLLSFTGWGSVARIFAGGHEGKTLGAVYTELKELLTEREWRAAMAATPNAHYTDPAVARVIWDIVRRLGFNGGNIIEPAAGTGIFLATMPTDIAENSTITAVELEPLTGGILKSIFEPQGVQVQVCGIEKANVPNGFYDLAVGNVPFGNYQVPDTKKSDFANWSIHNYFFGKAIEMVRPGGLVVFITSAHTMDGNLSVRKWLSVHAEFVEAIRLPAGSFQRQAKTDVVADIIVLRKRAMPMYNSNCVWAQECVNAPEAMLAPGQELEAYFNGHRIAIKRSINPWFAQHPARVAGKIHLESGQYTGKLDRNLIPRFDGSDADLHQHLSALVQTMCENIYKPKKRETDLVALPEKIRPTTDAKPGAFVMHGNKLCLSEGESWVDVDEFYKGKVRARVLGMMRLRDCARALIQYQCDTEDDAGLAPLQAKLHRAYDDFVAANGYLSDKMNVRAFRSDPDCPLVMSLEVYDEEAKRGFKADIFNRRTIRQPRLMKHVESVKDAMLLSLAQYGRINLRDMAQRCRKKVSAVVEALKEQGLAFKDPVTGQWIEADAYLCGNVSEKINAVKASGGEFVANLPALEAVLPVPLGPGEIALRLCAPWIPSELIKQFAEELMGAKPGTVEVSYASEGAVWSVKLSGWDIGTPVLRSVQWGTAERDFYVLLEAVLNQQPPTITYTDLTGVVRVHKDRTMAARQKYEAIKDEFKMWAWRDAERSERLCAIYNTQFNQIVPRKWDGSHLVLPGLSDAYKPYAHQLNAIWRILTGGNTLLAHVVGAGKSLTMQAAAMELRRLGKANKPLHVVPNHMLVQFTQEFLRAYPTAKVLMASKEDLQGDKRREFVARIATGDWDSVVMTHSTFERIKCRPQTMKDFVDEMLDKAHLALGMASDSGSKRSIKEMEKRLKTIESKLAKAIDEDIKDDLVYFEDLSVDWIAIDEAHLFKNLMRISKLPRVAGLPNTASQRALDLLIKTQSLRAVLGGKEEGVCFATATPLANSIGEMHTMQRFLQPVTLEKMGLLEFDAWAATFGESVTGMEIAPDGSGYRMNTRFSRFVNLPELMSIFSLVADIQTRKMLNLPTPAIAGGRPKVVVSPACENLKAYTAGLVERADKIRGGSVKPSEDNMLKVTHEGRLAALDMRLIDSTLQTHPETKIAKVRQEVLRIHEATQERKGLQLVFCDISTPKQFGFSVYNQLHAELVANGINENEIAFIHDFKTDAAKNRLFQMCREGQIRVLMGSTLKMGFGTNVQRLLKAIHHIEAPWRPSDVEQRDGRGLRMGNTWDEIELLRYCTEGSFDAYMWQTLETKSSFIEQIMAGDRSLRTVEDVSVNALSYAEIKAIASGNPLMLEKATVDAEIMRMCAMRDIWLQDRWHSQRDITAKKTAIAHTMARAGKRATDAQKAMSVLDAGVSFEPAKGSIADATKEHESLVDKLGAACMRASYLSATLGDLRIGNLGGYEINIRRSLMGKWIEMVDVHGDVLAQVNNPSVTQVQHTGKDVLEMITKVANGPEEDQRRIDRMQLEIEQLEAHLAGDFPDAEKLMVAQMRQAEINAQLDLDKADASAAVMGQDEVAKAANLEPCEVDE